MTTDLLTSTLWILNKQAFWEYKCSIIIVTYWTTQLFGDKRGRWCPKERLIWTTIFLMNNTIMVIKERKTNPADSCSLLNKFIVIQKKNYIFYLSNLLQVDRSE
jgi:hypothetical protein